MNIGINYILVSILKPEEYGTVTCVSRTGTERALQVAKVIGDYTTVILHDSDTVVVDDTYVAYWIDDTTGCIDKKGVLCHFDPITKDCRAFDDDDFVLDSMIVVKASMPDSETLMRNTFIQNGLVVIGGMESGILYNPPMFDLPVAITVTGDNVKHLITDSGDYFIATKNDLIVEFDTPAQGE